ncbi:MAG: hypothetical protein IJH05_03500 [Firmicutes bacterium]|nr:hypothetical protein [Bacillota bacterium]
MIEKIVLDYLSEALDYPVYLEHQEVDEYVMIEKTGSGFEDQISSATLAIQSHARSMLRAIEINQEVKEAMKSIIILDDISSVRLNSDYNFTDTETKHYRYQAVYDLTFYE